MEWPKVCRAMLIHQILVIIAKCVIIPKKNGFDIQMVSTGFLFLEES